MLESVIREMALSRQNWPVQFLLTHTTAAHIW